MNQSAGSAGVAASRGNLEKHVYHEAEVHKAGGVFVPLVMETLGLWSSVSLKFLKEITVRTTSQSGLPQLNLAVSLF